MKKSVRRFSLSPMENLAAVTLSVASLIGDPRLAALMGQRSPIEGGAVGVPVLIIAQIIG